MPRRSIPRPSLILPNSLPAARRAIERARSGNGSRTHRCLKVSAADRQPALQKQIQPRPRAVVVDGAVGEMGLARLGARQLHAVVAARGPLVNHGVGHVGVDLQREGAIVADRLDLESIALGQKLGAGRQVETLAVPLIDAFRPDADGRETRFSRPDRVIADLGMAVRMAKDAAAQIARAHLRAEANTEEWLVLP